MAGTSRSGRHLSPDGELDRLSEEAIECRGQLAAAVECIRRCVHSLNAITARLVELRARRVEARKAAA